MALIHIKCAFAMVFLLRWGFERSYKKCEKCEKLKGVGPQLRVCEDVMVIERKVGGCFKRAKL